MNELDRGSADRLDLVSGGCSGTLPRVGRGSQGSSILIWLWFGALAHPGGFAGPASSGAETPDSFSLGPAWENMTQHGIKLNSINHRPKLHPYF